MLKTCPTCGRRNLRLVTRDVECNFRGHEYTTPGVQFHECPDCGEKLYDREAMRKMEAHRPKGRRKSRVA
jgi:YgiT-type zinc finger domain-containing protein